MKISQQYIQLSGLKRGIGNDEYNQMGNKKYNDY